jgi:hypothetical protein
LKTSTIVGIDNTIGDALSLFGPATKLAYDFVKTQFPETFSTERLINQTIGAGVVEDVLSRTRGLGINNLEAAYDLGSILGVSSWAETATGIPVTYLTQSIQYAFNYANPQYIPSQSELDGMYLNNQISGDRWTCLTRANGNLPLPFRDALLAKQWKPDHLSVVQLYRRGVIPDLATYYERLRGLGVLDRHYANELLKVSEQLPGISDQLRFMVRDSWDDTVAEQYGYDTDFAVKFNAQARKLAEATGVPESVFQLYWRAHWDIPSNTALYEMLHRLRPDRPDVEELNPPGLMTDDDWIKWNKSGRPLVVTRSMVRRALQVNDMSPGWVEPLLDISYRPITNTDARRMYEIGTFDEKDLYHAFRTNGYDKSSADKIVKHSVAEKRQRIANQSGVLTARKIAKAYRTGSISRVDALNKLSAIIFDPATRERVVDGVDAEVRLEIIDTTLKAYRKRFVYGEINAFDLDKILDNLNIPPARRQDLLDLWTADKLGHRKEPRVQLLCKWYTTGMMTWDEYYARLDRLGYAQDDIVRIMKTCLADEQAKRAREAAAAAEKLRKEQERLARDTVNKLNAKAKELEKQIKELQKQEQEEQQKAIDKAAATITNGT